MQFVSTDLEMLDSSNRGTERQQAFAEGGDVTVTRAIAILQEHVVLQHRSVPVHARAGCDDRRRAESHPRGLDHRYPGSINELDHLFPCASSHS
jgi:hypothetical protein